MPKIRSSGNEAEQAFAESRDSVIISTRTLDLGIDVGALNRITQVNAPRQSHRSSGGSGAPAGRSRPGRNAATLLLLEQGVGLAVVQEMMGHSDSRATRGHTHVATPLVQDAARRRGRALFGEVETRDDEGAPREERRPVAGEPLVDRTDDLFITSEAIGVQRDPDRFVDLATHG